MQGQARRPPACAPVHAHTPAHTHKFTRTPPPHTGDRRPAAEPRPRVGGDHGQEAALRLARPGDPAIRPHGQRLHGVSSPRSPRLLRGHPAAVRMGDCPGTRDGTGASGAGCRARGHCARGTSSPFRMAGPHGWWRGGRPATADGPAAGPVCLRTMPRRPEGITAPLGGQSGSPSGGGQAQSKGAAPGPARPDAAPGSWPGPAEPAVQTSGLLGCRARAVAGACAQVPKEAMLGAPRPGTVEQASRRGFGA